MRFRIAALTLFSLAAVACGADERALSSAAEQPNIILIIADDQGYRDFGFMGSEVAQTPNIDRLAEGGSVFPLAYNTASMCRPSLTTLLTGLDYTQWIATSNAYEQAHPGPKGSQLISAFDTLPRVLGRAGYARLQTGKFWTGTYAMGGFSHGLKTLQADRRYAEMQAGGAASLAVGRTTLAPVTEFIDAHVDQPFFVWFAPMLPHTPHDAPKRFTDLYAERNLSAHERAYFANVSRLDAAVGKLMAHLDARGLRERTLIVFLTDNGWESEKRDEGAVFVGGPKGKSSMYELGWRTPIVFNWPGVVPAGKTRSTLVSTVDLFPTLLDYAQAPAVADRPGLSLRPVIHGSDPMIRSALFGSDRGVRPRETAALGLPMGARAPTLMARTDRWHYIWNPETDRDALYAMHEDPREEANVAERHPQEVKHLREEIEAWHTAVQRPVPLPDR